MSGEDRRSSGSDSLMEAVYKDILRKESTIPLASELTPLTEISAAIAICPIISVQPTENAVKPQINAVRMIDYKMAAASHSDVSEAGHSPPSPTGTLYISKFKHQVRMRPLTVVQRQVLVVNPRRLTSPVKSLHSISSASVASFVKTRPQDEQSLARSIRINHKRQSRVSEHLQNYIRVNVVIDKSVRMLVVVDVRHNVCYLSRLIEAEFCLRYMQESNSDGLNRSSAQSKFNFECGPLYNSKQHELRFDTMIKNALSMNDTIQVANVFQTAEESKMFSGISNHFSMIEGFSMRGSNDVMSSASTNLSKRFTKSPSADCVYQRMPIHDSNTELISFDDKFKITLSNRLFLRKFMEYCVTQMCAESLLFYIDVEIFQSCVNPVQKTLFAYYIYQVYIASGAPLQINLTSEIKAEIKIPALKDIHTVDLLVYDEAQQYIYTSLKGHTFFRFTKTEEFAQFVEVNREDRMQYNLAQLRGSYFAEFYFDADTITDFLTVFDKNAPASHAASAATHRLHVSRPFRDTLMKDSLIRIFPDVKLARDDYFECLENSIKEEKKSKISKEKRIRKFFGESPTTDLMSQQASFNPKATNTGVEMFKSSYLSSLPLQESVSEDDSSVIAKRKQVRKLHGFFGDINFTKDFEADGSNRSLVFETPMYSLGDVQAHTEDNEQVHPVLSNDSNNLDKKVKMQLSRTRMKIVQVMGGEVNDDLIVKTQTRNVTRLNAELVSEDDAESVNSHTSTTEPTDDCDLTRDIRIKRLNKLRQYLGEKVTEADMGAPSPHTTPYTSRKELRESIDELDSDIVSVCRNDTSPDAKALQMKRSKKLGHMFGELPPPKMILTPKTHVESAQRHRISIHGLESFIKSKNEEQVLDLANKFFSLDFNDDETPPKSPVVFGASTLSILNPNQASSLAQPASPQTPTQKEKSLRKKKVDKLKNFFGDVGTDVGTILEHAVIEDIERDIEDELRELLMVKAELVRIKGALKVRGGYELGELEGELRKLNARGKRAQKDSKEKGERRSETEREGCEGDAVV